MALRLLTLAVLLLACSCGDKSPKPVSGAPDVQTATPNPAKLRADRRIQRAWRTVIRVVDGDTIILNGRERVRLIGVDTPESVHERKPVEYFALEASAFTKRAVEGKKVWLEYDQERTDKYGRTLAYVYMADGRVLNEEIVREGYGHVFRKFPFKHKERYLELERQARASRLGLWSE